MYQNKGFAEMATENVQDLLLKNKSTGNEDLVDMTVEVLNQIDLENDRFGEI